MKYSGITILDLIGAHENFKRDNELIGKFVRFIEKSILGIAPFDISFKGIIVSSVGILAKGYYQEGLQEIRTRMRDIAATEGINFQERYQSISAHITFVRFKSAIRNRPALSSYIQKEYDREIGTMTVREIHLVIHDWYNRKKEELNRFTI